MASSQPLSGRSGAPLLNEENVPFLVDRPPGNLFAMLSAQFVQSGGYLRQVIAVVVKGHNSAGCQLAPHQAEIVPDVSWGVVSIHVSETDDLCGNNRQLGVLRNDFDVMQSSSNTIKYFFLRSSPQIPCVQIGHPSARCTFRIIVVNAKAVDDINLFSCGIPGQESCELVGAATAERAHLDHVARQIKRVHALYEIDYRLVSFTASQFRRRTDSIPGGELSAIKEPTEWSYCRHYWFRHIIAHGCHCLRLCHAEYSFARVDTLFFWKGFSPARHKYA